MLYAVFRGLSRLALRWFYRDVTVVGADHIPRTGPVMVAVNHPNALVDALVACLGLATYDKAVATIRKTFDVLSVKRF